MTDDFALFSSASGVDPDIALMTAFLARELSPVQIAAVQDRLETDAAFRERVQPIIESWVLPGSLRDAVEEGTARTAASRAVSPLITTPTIHRRVPMTRIAAVIALAILPLVGVAQVAVYVARHPDAPGHRLAHAIVPSSLVEVRPASPRIDSPILDAESQTAKLTPIQQSVPVVDLPAPSGKSTRTLGGVVGLKEAPDGRVLVNDTKRRRLLLFEADLASAKAMLDSIPGSAVFYGGDGHNQGVGPLLSFTADSSLLLDPGTNTFRVLNAHGQVIRALVPVIPATVAAGNETFTLRTSQNSLPDGVDALGRRYFTTDAERLYPVSVPKSSLRPTPDERHRVEVGGGGGRGGTAESGFASVFYNNRPSDSLPILRADYTARRVDTVAQLVRPPMGLEDRYYATGRLSVVYGSDGKPETVRQDINPIYVTDDWAVLPDGTIGIVRAHDYHVDWIHSDGSKTSSPKMPYDWKPITEADKQHLIDSTKAFIDSAEAADMKYHAWDRANGSYALAGRPFRQIPYGFVPLSQIADYYPPFNRRSVLADRDGNLWILPNTTKLSKQGELVYDVVNEKQGLVKRVRLPLGRSIAGFGKGVVYLQEGDLKAGFSLEKIAVPGAVPR